MGYSRVEVTSPTNDKGVDVVADIELGISSVREVVQVKRYKGSIGRRVLDEPVRLATPLSGRARHHHHHWQFFGRHEATASSGARHQSP